MARARAIPDLACEESFYLAAARVVEIRAAEAFEHSEGVLNVDDVEPLHDMRVATRRLRAAMEIFKPCFPAKPFKAALKEVKKTADALGKRRDRDVSIGILSKFAVEIADADRIGVETLLRSLRQEQRTANLELDRFLTGRMSGLKQQLDELVAAARESAPVDDEVAG